MAADIAVRDDGLVMDVITNPVYMQPCPPPWVWETYRDGGWIPLDPFPTNVGDAGYYVQQNATVDGVSYDGGATYTPPGPSPSHDHGCVCSKVIDGRYLGRAPNEYYLVGTKPAPDAGAGDPAVPIFESRPSAGPRRIIVTYFKDDQCQTPLEQTFEFPATP